MVFRCIFKPKNSTILWLYTDEIYQLILWRSTFLLLINIFWLYRFPESTTFVFSSCHERSDKERIKFFQEMCELLSQNLRYSHILSDFYSSSLLALFTSSLLCPARHRGWICGVPTLLKSKAKQIHSSLCRGVLDWNNGCWFLWVWFSLHFHLESSSNHFYVLAVRRW